MIQQATLTMAITDGMNPVERAIKRLFDFTVALIGIILLSPVYLLVYILLKKQGDGPVIFSQERIGYHGRPFRILKFRTIAVESDDDRCPQLVQNDDDRITPLCKYLREHHLDELPQLWNVLCGEMSLIGPRPERQYFINQIMQVNGDYEYIFMMRPGCTSMATIYNGYTYNMEKMLIRLQMDLEYLQKRSLLLDLKILFTTFEYIVLGKKF